MNAWRKLAAAWLCGALLFVPAAAQDFGRVAPRQPLPPSMPAPPQAPSAALPPAPAQDAVLVGRLKGLRFVSSAARIQRNGVSYFGVVIEGLPFADTPQLRDILQTYIGRPLSLGDLPRIAKTITDYYRAHKRPVVEVSFPEQDVSTGVIQAVVTEYRVGKVKVSGNYFFGKGLLASELGMRHGDPVDFGMLEGGLNVLNRNPFRTVNLVLQKSDEIGATDIALTVDERLPVRLYAAFDNTGSPVTGRDRYSLGFNWGNVLGLDHQFSYQFITSPDLWRTRHRGPGLSDDPRFVGHSFDYLAPLAWGDLLDVFGSAVTQVPDLGPDFGQVGHSLQLGVRYQVPLRGSARFTQQLQFGFDFKRADNNLAFGGVDVFASATNTEQFVLLYSATLNDGHGQTELENTLVWSPGGLSGGNTTAAFAASGVTGARASYVYDNLRLTRLVTLPWRFSALARVDAQIASTELLPGEQLGAGGTDSVRGYDERAANGSDGVLANLELRSPAISPLGDLVGRIEDRAQALVFWDYGLVSYKNLQASGPRQTELQSVGAGLRYGIGRYLDVRFDYGWQLERLPAAGAKLGNLATISVSLGY